MKDNDQPMQGEYTLLIKETNLKEVFIALRNIVDQFDLGPDYYEHLIENTSIDFHGDMTKVSLPWDENELHTQAIAFELQEQLCPGNDISTLTFSESPDGTINTQGGKLLDNDTVVITEMF